MKAFLILADAGSSHPDGTFSLLRGGITEFNVPKNKPATFKGCLIARVVGDRGEAGPHEFKIRCVTQDGGSILPTDVSATFEVPPKGGAAHIVMDLQLIFPSHGTYEFSIAVDKLQMDTWPLDVKEVKLPEKR